MGRDSCWSICMVMIIGRLSVFSKSFNLCPFSGWSKGLGCTTFFFIWGQVRYPCFDLQRKVEASFFLELSWSLWPLHELGDREGLVSDGMLQQVFIKDLLKAFRGVKDGSFLTKYFCSVTVVMYRQWYLDECYRQLWKGLLTHVPWSIMNVFGIVFTWLLCHLLFQFSF